jgi:hypothetical protein
MERAVKHLPSLLQVFGLAILTLVAFIAFGVLIGAAVTGGVLFAVGIALERPVKDVVTDAP